ncbi:MAG: N-acetyltransferase family protein [Pseudomonadota bacterium]
MIRDARPEDAGALSAIYGPYVANTAISFEDTPPDAEDMAGRVALSAGHYPFLVLEEEGAVIGFASASAYRPRPAYRRSVSTGIYLSQHCTGRGLGRTLYEALIAALVERQFHVLIAGITLPNDASTGLHRALGFAPVGVLREVGWKFERWHDVEMWQLTLRADAG